VTIVRSLLNNCFLLLLVLTVSFGLTVGQEQQPAQEEQTQDDDVRYTPEEYTAYQAAVEEPDLSKREDAILAFAQTNPKSSLVEYALGEYQQMLVEHQKNNDMQKLATAGEKLLAIRPDNIPVTYLTGLGQFQTKQYAKAVPNLEKVYEKQPEPSVAFMLAMAYGSEGLKNDDKFIQWGQIACSQFEPKDCYQILGELTRIAADRKQWDKAADFSKQKLQALEAMTKPENVPSAEWEDYVARERAIAYAAQGRAAFEKENMAGTLDFYGRALKTYKKLPALNGEAYYHMGLAHWKNAKMEAAMTAFAKGSVQKDAPHQKPNRDQLEFLYKSTHNGSLAGIEDFLEEALRRP
jgi:tetratricopeptide (TPR) repeat protein